VLAALPPPGPPPFQSAELLAPAVLRAAPHGRVIRRLGTRSQFGLRRVVAVIESRGRWMRIAVPELGNGRSGWIAARGVLEFAVDWRLDVSLGRRRLIVRHAGRVVQRASVAVGRPGSPTPTGRFAVTDRIRFSGASPYGVGALALTGHQPDIPQGWGGGDRLAIHGTQAEGTVGSAASLGCLRAHRRDIRRLIATVPLGTPVFIRD
jgi:L,D-transpeptidase catalytic domain